MNKELDNAFTDVRNAFRLLARYQSRVLDIVDYIREQTPYTGMWGLRRYCNVISTRKNCPVENYANLNVYRDMWGWDFLYNYLFEYYFGEKKFGRKTIEMSVIQVSDDGYYRSMANNPSRTDISTFLPSDESGSYFVFTAGWKAWLCDDTENDSNRFLHKFLAGYKDLCVFIDKDKKHWAITKRYPMQRFSSQNEADKVLADFGKIVMEHTRIDLFKSK